MKEVPATGVAAVAVAIGVSAGVLAQVAAWALGGRAYLRKVHTE